ncbi:hypothetical protein DFH07DRAFT_843894 [Mycena maculata]|uniref:Cytochrome P450 n=1 Tax=Mycena maculata TaxID=230809 RepID=A0AAD7MW61_9AGAR|nr:hypothetical protein DFH07DRAFT_843894 [Mycena maculata]
MFHGSQSLIPLPVLLLPPVATTLFLSGIGARPNVALHVPLSLLSLPGVLFIVVQWNDYSDRAHRARNLHAVLSPRVAYKSIGGRNTMRSMIDNFQRGENFAEWARTHGPVFNLRIMFENRMFTTEPEHIKSVLSTNFHGFEKGSNLRFQFGFDDLWKFHRGISRSFSIKERISDLQGYARHSDRALTLLSDRLQSGHAVDFQDLASRYTIDWAADFLFGANVGSLTGPLPYPAASEMNVSKSKLTAADAFVKGLSAAETQASMRMRFGPVWSLLELRRATRSSSTCRLCTACSSRREPLPRCLLSPISSCSMFSRATPITRLQLHSYRNTHIMDISNSNVMSLNFRRPGQTGTTSTADGSNTYDGSNEYSQSTSGVFINKDVLDRYKGREI